MLKNERNQTRSIGKTKSEIKTENRAMSVECKTKKTKEK